MHDLRIGTEASLSCERPNLGNEKELRLKGLSRSSLMSRTRLNDSSISRTQLIMKQREVPVIKSFESEAGHYSVKSFEEICRRERENLSRRSYEFGSLSR